MQWKKLSSKIVYENPWLRLREDEVIRPDGSQGIYSVLERTPASIIIAFEKASESIFFINEYRYPIEKTILQLPAGTSDAKENSLESAQRELLEETGIKADNWKELGKFYIGPGHESVCAHVFLATELDVSGLHQKVNQSDDALISEVLKFSIAEVKELIRSGKIECGITLAALQLFFLEEKA